MNVLANPPETGEQIKALKSQADGIYRQIRKLEKEELNARLSKLVGKHYVGERRYTDRANVWRQYTKVFALGVGDLCCFVFHEDSLGVFEIWPLKVLKEIPSGDQEISAAAFHTAWRDLLANANALAVPNAHVLEPTNSEPDA